MADLGRDLGASLTEREAEYLIAREWAETADDILWRRSKLGLHLSPEEQAALRAHMTPPAKAKTTKRKKA